MCIELGRWISAEVFLVVAMSLKLKIMPLEGNIYSVKYVVLSVFVILFVCDEVVSSKFDGVKNVTNITVGYLTVDRTLNFMRGKQGRVISGAISYALELINNDTTILPSHRLNLIWGDTMADTLVGTRLLTDQWRKGAQVFIGLEDSCSVEAKVAAAWNLPMISYVSLAYDKLFVSHGINLQTIYCQNVFIF